MKVDARNKTHQRAYRIYLDGVDISEIVQTADDIAHEVEVVLRNPRGQIIRGNGGVLKATVRGHVVIVVNSNTVPMRSTVQ